MAIEISPKVLQKLEEKHSVTREEVEQCFANRNGKAIEDVRPAHRTTPPTLWFVSETDFGKKLKIVFVLDSDGTIFLRTAYEASEEERRIYSKYEHTGI